MPYVQRITKAGKTIEIEKYYTAKYGKKGGKNKKKTKVTKEAQKKVNSRMAERKLRLLMNENFGYGDFHIVLDYVRKKGQPERTKQEMRKDIKKFLDILRKEYRKLGAELKYIHVMEIGEKGARHHHLVINQIDTKILQEAWYKAYEGHNRVKVFPLDDSGDYSKLASYFVKQTDKVMGTEYELQGKRWNSSRNLRHPIPEYKIITNRNWFKCEPKAKKGYYIDKDSVEKGVHNPEYGGYGYFRYRLIQNE